MILKILLILLVSAISYIHSADNSHLYHLSTIRSTNKLILPLFAQVDKDKIFFKDGDGNLIMSIFICNSQSSIHKVDIYNNLSNTIPTTTLMHSTSKMLLEARPNIFTYIKKISFTPFQYPFHVNELLFSYNFNHTFKVSFEVHPPHVEQIKLQDLTNTILSPQHTNNAHIEEEKQIVSVISSPLKEKTSLLSLFTPETWKIFFRIGCYNFNESHNGFIAKILKEYPAFDTIIDEHFFVQCMHVYRSKIMELVEEGKYIRTLSKLTDDYRSIELFGEEHRFVNTYNKINKEFLKLFIEKVPFVVKALKNYLKHPSRLLDVNYMKKKGDGQLINSLMGISIRKLDESKLLKAFKLLFGAGANVNLIGSGGHQALDLLAFTDKLTPAILQLFMDHNASLNHLCSFKGYRIITNHDKKASFPSLKSPKPKMLLLELINLLKIPHYEEIENMLKNAGATCDKEEKYKAPNPNIQLPGLLRENIHLKNSLTVALQILTLQPQTNKHTLQFLTLIEQELNNLP